MTYSNLQTVGRPITVSDEGLPLSANVGSFNFTGAGVDVTAIGADITVDIPGAVSGLAEESAVGAVDNSNLIFTLVNNPSFITVEGTIQEEGTDYTIAGAGPYTITFAVGRAPQVIDGIAEKVRGWY